ncbi:MAG: bifunctional DNA-formamidopyrimidine glycosylase/DNA-(apurinic or apyrimidinic site) lyase [Desulfuromonas sp.]|nr:bifunctional DNA-formamidopyrimidine glycosylase/DNA-(apurinic or apyrimidinic site) lyase [Desulfuromonas sp.]
MPELPEVETVRAGLCDLITSQTIREVKVYQSKLRYPVPADISARISGQVVQGFERRAKYLLLKMPHEAVIIHLGMSGSLRWLSACTAPEKHDHVDILFTNGGCLRYRDPRRFGLIVLSPYPPAQHRLLSSLGPEPLSDRFDALYLYEKSRSRRLPIKSFIMDNHCVVGVGNIYANEALFSSGLHPKLPAERLTMEQCYALVGTIKDVLSAAIAAGGTTLQDFVNGHGQPGYFQQQLYVYGRAEQPCLKCGTFIETVRIGQRSSYYCPECQIKE